jgi:1-acyl-sn-glycerol-3-phosphate acyltransferase
LIRASIRLALLVAWILFLGLFALVATIVTLGNRRVAASLGPAILSTLSLGACRIAGIRVARSGDPPPPGPCLMAPNHWGYLDILVLASLYRGVFVSRADVADWPVIGLFARVAATIFLRREVKRDAVRAGAEVERLLHAGHRVTAFLEGGAGRGDRIRPFKSPLLEAAVATGTPCRPVAIGYRLPRNPDVDPASAIAWTDGGFGAHLFRMLRLRGIDATVTFLPARTGDDRKVLAKRLEDDVRTIVEGAAAG